MISQNELFEMSKLLGQLDDNEIKTLRQLGNKLNDENINNQSSMSGNNMVMPVTPPSYNPQMNQLLSQMQALIDAIGMKAVDRTTIQENQDDALKEENDRLIDENELLKSQLSEQHDMVDRVNKEKHALENTLMTERKDLSAKYQDVKQQLAEKEIKVNELSKQIVSYQAQNDTLKDSLTQTEKDVSRYKQNYLSTNDSQCELQTKYETLSNTYDDLKQRKDKLVSEKHELETELHNLKSTMSEYDSQAKLVNTDLEKATQLNKLWQGFTTQLLGCITNDAQFITVWDSFKSLPASIQGILQQSFNKNVKLVVRDDTMKNVIDAKESDRQMLVATIDSDRQKSIDDETNIDDKDIQEDNNDDTDLELGDPSESEE